MSKSQAIRVAAIVVVVAALGALFALQMAGMVDVVPSVAATPTLAINHMMDCPTSTPSIYIGTYPMEATPTPYPDAPAPTRKIVWDDLGNIAGGCFGKVYVIRPLSDNPALLAMFESLELREQWAAGHAQYFYKVNPLYDCDQVKRFVERIVFAGEEP